MIETDLRFVEDGEVVIMHNDTLDRTTNCSGPVSKWKLADILAKCDAGRLISKSLRGKGPDCVRLDALLGVEWRVWCLI